MSVREKTKILYSRNGIRIIKTEHLTPGGLNKTWCFESTIHEERLENVSVNQKRGEYETIKHESPLGFYYYTQIWKDNKIIKPKSVSYKKYIIWLGSEKYELEYPYRYDNNGDTQRINVEMRPWDIAPGYKGMPDNMINALLKEATHFIDIIFEYKKQLRLNMSPDEYRKDIMIDLFGYEDEPKVQPNNIKILAHGFDLKTSFRKPKQS